MADEPDRRDEDGGGGAADMGVRADGPVRDLADWKRIWDQDVPFPIEGRPGVVGKLGIFFKRAARPFVKASTADLWDRQRVFNQILLDHIAEREARLQEVLDEAAQELEWRAQEMRDQVVLVSRLLRDGLQDVMHHNDALFARVDQKLDRYRRQSIELNAALNRALARLDGEAADDTDDSPVGSDDRR